MNFLWWPRRTCYYIWRIFSEKRKLLMTISVMFNVFYSSYLKCTQILQSLDTSNILLHLLPVNISSLQRCNNRLRNIFFCSLQMWSDNTKLWFKKNGFPVEHKIVVILADYCYIFIIWYHYYFTDYYDYYSCKNCKNSKLYLLSLKVCYLHDTFYIISKYLQLCVQIQYNGRKV